MSFQLTLANPVCALAMADMARKERTPAVVNTAAASALGRMFLRLSLRSGLKVIHVVRRPEQAALLKSQGAVYVLDSCQKDFLPSLTALCKQLDARLAFDAVGGEMTLQLLCALPRGGKVVIYGAPSAGPSWGHFTQHSHSNTAQPS